MPEVGVERLAAGDDQKHRPERDQADRAVAGDKRDCIEWIDRRKHARIVGNVQSAGHRHRQEPEDRDRTEQHRDFPRAARLHREHGHQQCDRDRQHVGLERRRHDLQALDRGQHRQGRRDQRRPVEHRGADHAEDQDHQGPSPDGAERQRRERERAALAVVVHPQQPHDVFQGDNDNQRPDDQREHAEHDLARNRPAPLRRNQRFTKRIERAGADIAIDDADAAQRQRPETRRIARWRFGRRLGPRRRWPYRWLYCPWGLGLFRQTQRRRITSRLQEKQYDQRGLVPPRLTAAGGRCSEIGESMAAYSAESAALHASA